VSDLERELTSVLASRAGESYSDPHAALAEHERRLAARAKTARNRSVAGVLAVVAVLGVSSALLLNGPSEPSQRVATQPAVEDTTATATPETSVVDTVKLTDFTADGKAWTAYLMITYEYDPPCAKIVSVPAGEPPSSTERYPTDGGCDHLIVQPDGNPMISQIRVLPVADNGPLPEPLAHLMVWAMVPETAEISVIGADGQTFTAEPLDTIEGVKYFLTSKSTLYAKRFTIRDANGTILRDVEFG
jgi:hypothetical protein